MHYSKEYSIKFSADKSLEFCLADGTPLPNCYVHSTKSAGFYTNIAMYRSNNIGKYSGEETAEGLDGIFDAYEVPVQYSSTMNGTYIYNNTLEMRKVLVSKDKKKLVFVTKYYTVLYKQISQRTTPNNKPIISRKEENGNEITTYTISNSNTLVDYMPPTNSSGYNTYTPSGNYNTTVPTNTNTAVLVGNYSAFGLSSGFNGAAVTHNQVFAVYKDNSGYYIIDPKTQLNTYLNYNSYSSYLNYQVSQYNYTFMTMLGTDIHWFVKL